MYIRYDLIFFYYYYFLIKAFYFSLMAKYFIDTFFELNIDSHINYVCNGVYDIIRYDLIFFVIFLIKALRAKHF